MLRIYDHLAASHYFLTALVALRRQRTLPFAFLFPALPDC